MQSMPSSSLLSLNLSPEPDLHPLYPSTAYIAVLLSSHSGLTPDQKAELVAHCLARSCIFGELSVLQYLLSDPQAQSYVDLGIQDEDGQGLISLAIHGFGAESERDVEREECVRLLIAQGADMSPDKSGWTPLHHAVLLSPPTLVSHLMTHGCSPFDVTRRNLTPLDIITAHSIMPGREDVALLLEEAMRGEGWTGGRMEKNRHLFDERAKCKGKQKHVQEDVGRVLGVHSKWWARDSDDSSSDSDDDGDEDIDDETLFTPPVDYSSMLVFSPLALPLIFDSLITNFQPSFRDSTPANTLYMLARFACLTCDHTWLEDLIIGATDCIEETFFNKPEDVTCLVFWLYNTTLWLHLIQCDNSINEACEMLGFFEIIEEVINSVFVFIIRFAERRVDQLLDSTLLDYSSLGSEFDSIQFESEWSVFRALGMKKSQPIMNASASRSSTSSPPSSSPHRPSSPTSYGTMPTSTSKGGFSSLRQSFARARNPTSATPLQSLFPDAPPPPSPADLISFLTALHTLLTLSDINPALTTQLWSQVMYWTSCEMFNRILTRKKYICRSKAIQIGMNLSSIEEWVGQMGLPRGVQTHFTPVRELLNWLQCLSSITEFPNLVATIQTMKCLNPLQMKRAVRDYKYEVNEGRMTDECVQYLTQLQKDWERHRVKLGVEALRKEMGERERDREREESLSSSLNDSMDQSMQSVSFSSDSSDFPPNQNIDVLFDKDDRTASWEPPKPPQVLGELLDSRHMLPLLFPSDPRMLAAISRPLSLPDDGKKKRPSSVLTSDSRSDSYATVESRCTWRARHRKVRQVGIGTLKWVDGVRSASRWGRLIPEDEDIDSSEEEGETDVKGQMHATPLTRKPSGRTKGRVSHGGDTTPIDR
ncbi:DIL domain-containing protein [Armillaria nabsnona]|nr:DIL domain-containing protein [Armillaria nabsnona]